MIGSTKGIICLCGNDGTGKSTLASLIPTILPQFHVIERSSKQSTGSYQLLRQQIKKIDFLTYRYSFQQDRDHFEPSTSINTEEGTTIPVYWIMLHLQPTQIFQRISKREEMGIYESKKCVEYYSYVYLQLAAYYGMAVVEVKNSPHQNAKKIAQLITSGAVLQIKQLNLKRLELATINSLNVQTQIKNKLTNDLVSYIIHKKWLREVQNNQPLYHFFFPQIEKAVGLKEELNWKLCYDLAARWILKNITISKDSEGQLSIAFWEEQNSFNLILTSPSFVYFTEGQSKLIYSVRSKNHLVQEQFNSKLWILLKSTIYSHTKQHTGQIQNLGKVRAVGSNLFLEMLRRNNIKHAYVAINKQGIIFSNKIQTNNVQIVFKRQFLGTDKHSYNLMEQSSNIVEKDGKYKCGIYIRFDWRNPNHYLKEYPKFVLNLSPYYYVIQKSVGKQLFFDKFLHNEKLNPFGDKCVSQDLITNYINTKKVKKAVLSLYCTFSYYCRKIGLDIIDGCFMYDREGSTVWSQINPDCMRVKKNQLNQTRVNYDKDIWRAGGSDSKIKILQKWTLFNKLFIDYFVSNRFHQTQLLNTTPLSYPRAYQADRLLNNHFENMPDDYINFLRQLAHCTQKHKEIIATIDISEQKPTLVKSSLFSENHSSNSLDQAHSYISVLPKIVLVDLDSAMNKETNNRKSIKSLSKKANNNIYAVGGGIRSQQVLFYYLYELLIPKIILSTNLELLNDLPKDIISKRIIVQLSINQNNQILTHGRTINTHQNVIKKMIQLSRLGVRIISLTFNHKEGHLSGIPRDQFRDIMHSVPGPIEKFIIAGGISSLDDLQFIWGFPKAVPQLGSAIWKNKISIADICNKLVNFSNEGLCPAIITDSSQKLLGEVFMNKQSIEMTCKTRELHRYSRKLKRLIKKGEQSGNTQNVVSMKLDCDNDCLNIIVQQNIKPFCHTGCQSCFDFNCQHKNLNIISLQNHLLRKKDTGSGYTKKMQENQNFALSKFIQESEQFSLTKSRVVEQGADVIAHMLMYFNAKGISFQDIMKQLQVRSTKIKQISQKKQDRVHYMGIMAGKYCQRIDQAVLMELGMKVIRPNNRSLDINYTIQDQQKYNKYFKGLHLKLIAIKSKDMSHVLNKNYISFCVNYTIMMENYPKTWFEHFRLPVSQIKLALLERNQKKIDPFNWTPSNKGLIASEYPTSVINYFTSLGIDQDCYSLIRVSGGTESFLYVDRFDYCDAIVASGNTVTDNNLCITKVLQSNIQAALYSLIK